MNLQERRSLHAELLKIDENLERAELTPAQRAAAVARRKEIWEVMHPNSDRNPVETRHETRRVPTGLEAESRGRSE